MKTKSATSVSIRALLGVAAGLLMIGGAAAQGNIVQADRTPIIVYTQQPAARISAAAAALAQQAREQGQVRVIVGLRFTMRSEDALPPAQAEQQLQALQAAQNAVASRVLGRVSGDDIVRFEFIPYMSIYVDATQLSRLLADPQVAVVQEDVPRPPLDKDSVPLIHADKLWANNDKGTGRTVAILDTGVAKGHPVLTGKVVSEACYSSNKGKTGVSLCPGRVTHTTAAGSGVNCPVTIAACKHGTHVASIAAAKQTADLIGVGPAADIIAMQVFTKLTTAAACNPNPAPCVLTYDTDWIQGLQRVYALRKTYHIDAVNMSLGGGKYAAACDATNPAAKTAITQVRGAGIAVLIAAGNNGYNGFISYPACISTSIAIASSTKPPEAESGFSNDSPLVKLLAPGSNIYAAVPPSGYEVMSGTSMATPAVTGSYALLRQAKPAASVDDALTALKCSAKTIPVLGVGRPRIDLLGAYNRLLLPKNVERDWSFSSASDANDWTPLIGKWVASGGTYRETVLQQGWIGSSTDNCNNSLQVIARMVRVDPGTEVFSNSGIVFKSTLNYSNSKYVSGYWLAYNKCPTDSTGYCDPSNPDNTPGQAVFWTLDNYSFANSSGGANLLCVAHVPVTVNGMNTVKVISRNNSHSYYLNGKLVCTVDDATYTTGPVMAAAYLASAGGHAYTLDFLDITSFDSKSAAAEIAGLIPPQEGIVMDPASLAPKATPPGMTPQGSRRQR